MPPKESPRDIPQNLPDLLLKHLPHGSNLRMNTVAVGITLHRMPFFEENGDNIFRLRRPKSDIQLHEIADAFVHGFSNGGGYSRLIGLLYDPETEKIFKDWEPSELLKLLKRTTALEVGRHREELQQNPPKSLIDITEFLDRLA